MVQIIEENRKPTFSERLNRSLRTSVEQGSQLYENYQQQQREAQREKQKRQALHSLVGEQGEAIADLPPELQKLYVDYALKGGLQQQKIAHELQKGDQKLDENRQKTRDLEIRRGLEPGSLSAYENDPAMAERISRPEKAKAPLGGLAGTPPSREEAAAIERVIRENPQASAEELELAFNKEPEILPGRTSNILESRRRSEEIQRKESPQLQRQELLTKAQAQADIEYDKELQNRAKKTVLKNESLDRIEKIIKKGVSGKPVDQILEAVGLISKTSEGRRELAAEVKNQYTDFKEVAGSQLSAMEFNILSGAYPNPNFSKEANLAIVKNLRIVGETLNEEYKIAEQLKKENGGKKPEDFQAKVNERLFGYIASRKEELKENIRKILNSQHKIRPGYVLMFANGDENDPMEVPESEVKKFIDMGDTLP